MINSTRRLGLGPGHSTISSKKENKDSRTYVNTETSIVFINSIDEF